MQRPDTTPSALLTAAMKPEYYRRIGLVITSAAIALVVWLWPQKAPELKPPLAPAPAVTPPVGQQPAPPHVPPPSVGSGPAYQPFPKGGAGKDPAKLRKVAEGFNVPISFWGNVVNQDGMPLSGVTVRYSIRQMTLGLTASPRISSEFYEMTTGDDGAFGITGEHGDSLTVDALTKQGYQIASRGQKGFAYAHAPEVFTPDQQSPVVFTMVRAAEVGQLERFSGRFGVPYNGTPVAVDPLTGRRGGSGELKISCLREPATGAAPARDYPWKLTVQLEGGGLIPIEPGAVYEAPAEGYQAQLDHEMRPGINWKSGVRQEYYFKTRQNLYGRLSIDLSLRDDEPDAFVSVSGMVNPTGSPVLAPAASVP